MLKYNAIVVFRVPDIFGLNSRYFDDCSKNPQIAQSIGS